MSGLISFQCQYNFGSALQTSENGYSGLFKIYQEMTDIRRFSARIGGHIPHSIKADLKNIAQITVLL